MPNVQDVLLSPKNREELARALNPNEGGGIGELDRDIDAKQDGLEIEIDTGEGVYVGVTPFDTNSDERQFDNYRGAPTAVLYVYLADIGEHKNRHDADPASNYAVMREESEHLRALAMELEEVLFDIFGEGVYELRRFQTDSIGQTYTLPLPPQKGSTDN